MAMNTSPSHSTSSVPARRLIVKTVLATVASGLVLLAGSGFLLMISGVYNIAADEPHLAPIRWMLRNGRNRSVEFHSKGIQNSRQKASSLVRNGFDFYRQNCQTCHGAPGVAPEQKGRGIDPIPPPLVSAANDWTDPELYWIISHGLKDSGMPAFAARLSESDRWAIVDFLRQIVFLSPADYAALSADSSRDGDRRAVSSIRNGDYGFGQLSTQGNPNRGKQLLRDYGCITCHTIPGIGWGLVGPPLTKFAERQYIAGSLVNVPSNAMDWVMNPKRFEPNTAMPELKVSRGEALDIMAYLYTLGDPKRLNMLRFTAEHRR